MFYRKRCEMLAVLLAVLFMFFASPGAAADQECLACHGERGAKDGRGRSIYVDAAKEKVSVHGSLGCTACHSDITEYPHPQRVARVNCATCHEEPATKVPKSIHAAPGTGAESCRSCHGDAHEIRPAATVAPARCADCHADELRDYQQSIHAAVRKAGDPQGAVCLSCHGPAHTILPAADPASPVTKRNLPNTCAACHSNPEFLARHNIPFAHPVEAYRLSIHGRALARGNLAVPSCSDCHGNHAIFPGRNPRSKVNHWNVPHTCGACHTQIRDKYLDSIHGQAMLQGSSDVPVCTDCHGEHDILAPSNPNSPVYQTHVSVVTCGRCHANTLLDKRYNLPLDRIPSFEGSYHGLALQAGSLTVANCASCHGVHDILPSNDPRSSINPANLGRTCGRCHAGAGEHFAIGPVHVLPASASEHPVVRWIRITYLIVIALTMIFMVFHNGLDFVAKLVRHAPRVETGEQAPRMNLNFRIAHWLVMVSFTVLVITGFALKFPSAWWAQPILLWESGLAFRGIVHRIAAVVLIAAVVYHAIHLVVSRRDRAILRSMRPGFEDLRDLLAVFRYNLGLSHEPPHFGKFNYAEKLEYLAFVWGTAIMTVSGFLLWFVNFTLRHFPKWVADAATAFHFYEAILATAAIVLWHFYMTIFDPDVYPLERSWLTGKTSADHLRRHRPRYYASLLSGSTLNPEPQPDPSAGSSSSQSVPRANPPAPARPADQIREKPSSDKDAKNG